MAPIGYDGVIVGMDVPVVIVVRAPTVVEVRFSRPTTVGFERAEISGRHYHAEIPEFHALVFTVAEDIA